MNYQETIEYLYSRLPMFQRVGAVAYKPGFDNILAICAFLDNPHLKFPSIHIAGTNGKGSTSHTLAAVLQEADYKTGLYTSPHLKSFTERIRIDGEEICQEFIVDFVQEIQALIEEIQPSFFEITVAMAFSYFAHNQVDIAVIEVGMGGRLDSTNIINPLVSVITNISFDHQEFLGSTLPLIAEEKAGIIKTHTPIVISEYQVETEPVFRQKAGLLNAPIYFAQDTYQINYHTEEYFELDIYKEKELIFEKLNPSLKGIYQLKNLAGILKTLDILIEKGWQITQNHIQKGIEQVSESTGLKGRWQIIGNQPLIICDTAHNEGGIREIIQQISQTPHQQLHLVLGFTKEKDLAKILPLYPRDAIYYFCQFNQPRTLSAEKLQLEAQKNGLVGKAFATVQAALNEARQTAQNQDLIFVGGSTFVVAEVEEI